MHQSLPRKVYTQPNINSLIGNVLWTARISLGSWNPNFSHIQRILGKFIWSENHQFFTICIRDPPNIFQCIANIGIPLEVVAGFAIWMIFWVIANHPNGEVTRGRVCDCGCWRKRQVTGAYINFFGICRWYLTYIHIFWYLLWSRGYNLNTARDLVSSIYWFNLIFPLFLCLWAAVVQVWFALALIDQDSFNHIKVCPTPFFSHWTFLY